MLTCAIPMTSHIFKLFRQDVESNEEHNRSVWIHPRIHPRSITLEQQVFPWRRGFYQAVLKSQDNGTQKAHLALHFAEQNYGSTSKQRHRATPLLSVVSAIATAADWFHRFQNADMSPEGCCLTRCQPPLSR